MNSEIQWNSQNTCWGTWCSSLNHCVFVSGHIFCFRKNAVHVFLIYMLVSSQLFKICICFIKSGLYGLSAKKKEKALNFFEDISNCDLDSSLDEWDVGTYQNFMSVIVVISVLQLFLYLRNTSFSLLFCGIKCEFMH